MIKSVIQGWKNLLNSFKTKYITREIRTTPVNPDEVRDQKDAFEKDRARNLALLAKERVKNARLTEQLKQYREPNGDEDPAIQLNEQLQQMENKQFEGSLNLAHLFKYLISKKKLKIKSCDDAKIFGTMVNLVMLSDGRLALIYADDNGNYNYKVGRNLRQIFKNVTGLVNQARMGYLMVNWNKDDKYVEDIMTREVPNVIMNNGKLEFSRFNTKMFGELLAEKEERISQQYDDLALYESYLTERLSDEQQQEVESESNKKRAQIAETTNKTFVHDIFNVLKEFAGVVKENVTLSQDQQIANESLETQEKATKKLLAEKEESATKSSVEIAKQQIKDDMEFLAEVGPTERETIKEVEKKQDSELTRKFNQMPIPRQQ